MQLLVQILVYISTTHLSGSETHPSWLGVILEKFLEITTTTLLKMNFPAWRLFLKTLLQKCCPQYLGNYTDYTDVKYLQKEQKTLRKS